MQMNDNTRQSALVTGGSRGIGAAIARRLAKDGFAVIVNYMAQAAEADALVAEISASGGRARAVQGDVSDGAAVMRLFDAASDWSGGLDVLVNNAGIMHLAPIAQMDDAQFERMLAINLTGTFNTLREAARRLRDGGRIINTSSTVTRLLQPGYGAYAATKAAVEAMTMVLARELRGRQITVNAVAPGPTATELFLTGKSEELVANLARLSPLERLGQPR
jgi:3-oxoacyl-[acyl-carrier protein] reductase